MVSFWPQVPGNFNQLQPNTATFADDNLYSNCDLASDMWQQLELACELE